MRLLLIDDGEADAGLVVKYLERHGFDVEWERITSAGALPAALERRPDAVIADYNVPGLQIRDTIATLLAADPDVPLIVVSGSMTAETGVEMLHLGAQDYISKSHLERLGPALRRSLDRAADRRRARAAETNFQSLCERLPVGVSRSLPTGETIQFNFALLEILRFPDAATYRAAASPLQSEVISPEDQARVATALGADGIARGVEVLAVRHDGTRGWIRLDLSATRGPDGSVSSIDAVVTDIDDRRRAQAALLESHAALGVSLDSLRESDAMRQRLLVRLIGAQEEERHRIALDIHDDAVQVMTAANIQLVTLGRKIADVELAAEIDNLVDTVAASTGRLRNLMFELEPPALERYGLMAALRICLEILTADTGIQHTLTGSLKVEPPEASGVLVYRIVQEALANVRKHSRAAAVAIAVENGGSAIEVSIKDDGVGFADPEVVLEDDQTHLGLASMRERAYLAGGTCVIVSSPGKGTKVEFVVPLKPGPTTAQRLPLMAEY